MRSASFDRWSNSDYGEDFEAHELVEEMMLLANEEIAKFLSRSQQISERAPLRTQLPPKDHKLDDWVREIRRVYQVFFVSAWLLFRRNP